RVRTCRRSAHCEIRRRLGGAAFLNPAAIAVFAAGQHELLASLERRDQPCRIRLDLASVSIRGQGCAARNPLLSPVPTDWRGTRCAFRWLQSHRTPRDIEMKGGEECAIEIRLRHSSWARARAPVFPSRFLQRRPWSSPRSPPRTV